MLLSKLVFLSVKNVIYLDDTSFNYDGFVNGDFDNDIDYATNINNAFSPLNEAIARLNDLNKIPHIVEKITVEADKTFDISNLERRPKQIVNVAVVGLDGSYRKLGHVMFGRNKARITSPYSTFNTEFYVEYKENIPAFSKSDLVKIDESGEDNNIDLYQEFGIDDTMCNYIIEYVQGKLLEPLAPELANMHITRAEAYFNNIDTAQESFPQFGVEKRYEIGE